MLRSIQHTLEAMSPTGTLPYGVPFSYDPRGTGAFPISASGLAALARFLSRLLRSARRLGYPSSDFLTGLSNIGVVAFPKLFSPCSFFESSCRTCASEDGRLKPKSLCGWSTDRAPSHNRLESWVTIEVFLLHWPLAVITPCANSKFVAACPNSEEEICVPAKQSPSC